MKVQTRNKYVFWLLFYLLASTVLYYLVFSYNENILPIIQSKKIIAPLLAMFIVLAASELYGNVVSIIFKNTLEKKLNLNRLKRKG
ncbi:hypothetical protein [Desulfoscipio gibsoniae]|uniref:Uncharacterized protein n=1 Tax=Desulfoscipio gibsoniae DSM 7213 TaxID=767817 RepID=R4KJU6_9FIRM|nr:hypothetical protein [Desulfoscipio gibsoniae]AGL03468.1 hypothetical protein Desgi_4215 [Desulfoscipio gibsoniae DSM 7213]